MAIGQDDMFVTVLGALGTLVVAASIVERGLAFVFEHDWFIRLFTKQAPDPGDNAKTVRVSKIPGLKGIIALAGSMGISFVYHFDILGLLFNNPDQKLTNYGMFVTGFVIAGGSAGAITIFQGYLNLNKESRDAILAARKAEAESAKLIAKLAVKEAAAKQKKAKTESMEAELRYQTAESVANSA